MRLTPTSLWLLAPALLLGCGDDKGDDPDRTDDSAPVDSTDPTDSGDSGPTDSLPPPECDDLPALPLTPDRLGIVSPAEDFAFDADGNVILVDERGNLLAITPDGERLVILPAAATFASGMRLLPDGDAVFGDAITGALYRVDLATGARTTLLSGLSYPNGIEIALDGTIFVSEQSGGRVRAVHPDTGASEVIAAGLYNPNGLSLTAEQDRLYIGSFGAGVIWALDRDGAGWAAPRVYATTPEAPGLPDNPCVEVDQACSTYTTGIGTCQEQYGSLLCLPDPDYAACDGLAAGDACTTDRFGDPLESACAPDTTGALACPRAEAESVLTCLDADPACTARGETGTCATSQEGVQVCYTTLDDTSYLDACAALQIGDACQSESNAFPWSGHCRDASLYGLPDPICLPDDYILSLHGGLDGLNADACGNVYVTEYLQQTVWRIEGEAATAEAVTTTLGQWIPNLHFGNGVGPWDPETLYVMDMERGLWSLPVGVRGHGDAFRP